jgi:hypothetical protein
MTRVISASAITATCSVLRADSPVLAEQDVLGPLHVRQADRQDLIDERKCAVERRLDRSVRWSAPYQWRISCNTSTSVTSASPRETAVSTSVRARCLFGCSAPTRYMGMFESTKKLLTKNVALRWAEEGVRVNSVHPGSIDTSILAEAKGTEFEDAMVGMTPMARRGTGPSLGRGGCLARE